MKRYFRESTLGLLFVASCLMFIAGSGSIITNSASAASSLKTGVVTARVAECPPNGWSPKHPLPWPAVVVVLHLGPTLHGALAVQTFESKSVVFPKNKFSGYVGFRLPVGEYQFVSSYEGPLLMVTVKSASNQVVSFGRPVCAV
jgi:hypothetical protein